MAKTLPNHQDYPKSVYVDVWEDMEVMCENWIALHGVDRTFCQEVMKSFAHQIEKN